MESVLVTKDMPISSILEACLLLDEAMQNASNRARSDGHDYLRYALIAGGVNVSGVAASIREELEGYGDSHDRD